MDSDSPESLSPAKFKDLPSRDRVRVVRRSIVRTTAGVVLLALVYIFAPLDSSVDLHPLLVMTVMFLIFAVLIYFSLRRIMTDDFPQLRAAQVAILTVSFYLFLFASLYLSMSTLNPAYFSEDLSHIGAFYFTVTVAATVGFGDITPINDLARIIVTVQMIMNIVLIGVGVRAILALGRSRASNAQANDPTRPPTS